MTTLPMQQRLAITRELEMQLADFWHEVDTNWSRNAAGFCILLMAL